MIDELKSFYNDENDNNHTSHDQQPKDNNGCDIAANGGIAKGFGPIEVPSTVCTGGLRAEKKGDNIIYFQ